MTIPGWFGAIGTEFLTAQGDFFAIAMFPLNIAPDSSQRARLIKYLLGEGNAEQG